MPHSKQYNSLENRNWEGVKETTIRPKHKTHNFIVQDRICLNRQILLNKRETFTLTFPLVSFSLLYIVYLTFVGCIHTWTRNRKAKILQISYLYHKNQRNKTKMQLNSKLFSKWRKYLDCRN